MEGGGVNLAEKSEKKQSKQQYQSINTLKAELRYYQLKLTKKKKRGGPGPTLGAPDYNYTVIDYNVL